jgi:hypothetical protein
MGSETSVDALLVAAIRRTRIAKARLLAAARFASDRAAGNQP